MIYTIAILYAIAEALYDYSKIKVNLPINHTKGWQRRAAVFGSCVGLVWATGAAFHPLEILGGAALFSSVFRVVLNYKRGLDIRYCSPSAFYDRLFIAISFAIKYRNLFVGWTALTSADVFSHFTEDYYNSDRFKSWVHRAGLLAYLVEISVSTICIML